MFDSKDSFLVSLSLHRIENSHGLANHPGGPWNRDSAILVASGIGTMPRASTHDTTSVV